MGRMGQGGMEGGMDGIKMMCKHQILLEYTDSSVITEVDPTTLRQN